MYNDQWLMIFEVMKKYKIDPSKTNVVIMGRSFGGMTATNMAMTTIGRALFKALVVIAPCYETYT
jgi:pimeloyl-ACP methyl ester carboxylesterase